MASTIDITKPITGAPTTKSVRDNFAAAHTEIEALQQQIGYADYNDYATQITPIAISPSTWTKLTNDTLGPQTRVRLPADVTSIWNGTTSQFDLTELPIDTMLNLRIDLTITTSGANQTIKPRASMAIGGVSPFQIEGNEYFYKTAGAHKMLSAIPFYVGSTDVKDFPAELQFHSDASCTVKVNGWFITVIKSML